MSIPNYVRIQIEHFKKSMKPVVGGTILEADAVYVDGEVYPILIIRRGGKEFLLQPMRDEEGNGPGALRCNTMAPENPAPTPR
jgi:hypothetical protein